MGMMHVLRDWLALFALLSFTCPIQLFSFPMFVLLIAESQILLPYANRAEQTLHKTTKGFHHWVHSKALQCPGMEHFLSSPHEFEDSFKIASGHGGFESFEIFELDPFFKLPHVLTHSMAKKCMPEAVFSFLKDPDKSLFLRSLGRF